MNTICLNTIILYSLSRESIMLVQNRLMNYNYPDIIIIMLTKTSASKNNHDLVTRPPPVLS